MLRVSLLIASLALTGPVLGQTTVYVDVDAVAPGSGTALAPYTSIQFAIDQLGTAPDATVLVAPGLYCENITRGLFDPISIIATGGPLETTLMPSGTGAIVDIYDVYLVGFTITGSTGGPALQGTGVYEFCILQGNERVGMHPIFTDPAYRRCTIVDNETGIHIGPNNSVHFSDSIIWDNDSDVLTTDSTFGSLASLSWCVYQPGMGAMMSPVIQDSIIGNPQLWSSVEFDPHLRANSPCIDAGDPALTDPDTTRGDIGAIPFDASYYPEPIPYCSTLPNSSGGVADISWSGSTSIADSTFTLAVQQATASSFGKFYYGPQTASVPFGDGRRCVGPGSTGFIRLYPIMLTTAVGAVQRQLNFGAPPTGGTGPGVITPGSTWFFQFWFRDGAVPGGSGFNLSNGLAVTFGP